MANVLGSSITSRLQVCCRSVNSESAVLEFETRIGYRVSLSTGALHIGTPARV